MNYSDNYEAYYETDDDKADRAEKFAHDEYMEELRADDEYDARD